MSKASEDRQRNRTARRAMKRAGVALMDRVTIDDAALAAGVLNGGNTTDLIAYQIAEGLGRLDAQGADFIGGKTVVTIGRHPDFPGGLTIELKAGGTRRSDQEINAEIIADARRKLGLDEPDESDGGLLAGP